MRKKLFGVMSWLSEMNDKFSVFIRYIYTNYLFTLIISLFLRHSINFFMFRGPTLPCTVLSRLWTPSSRRPPAISAPSSWRSGGSLSLSLYVSLCLSVSLSLELSRLWTLSSRQPPAISAPLSWRSGDPLSLSLSLSRIIFFFK